MKFCHVTRGGEEHVTKCLGRSLEVRICYPDLGADYVSRAGSVEELALSAEMTV